VLAERIAALLLEINRRFGTPIPPGTGRHRGPEAHWYTPSDAEFRVGTMGLGWDSEAQTWWSNCLPCPRPEFDASVVLDDAEEGPDAVAGLLTPESAREFATPPTGSFRPAGRPCPFCDDAPGSRGSYRVRNNGYRRGAIAGAEDETPILSSGPDPDDLDEVCLPRRVDRHRTNPLSEQRHLSLARRISVKRQAHVRLQAHRRRAATVGFPGRHAARS